MRVVRMEEIQVEPGNEPGKEPRFDGEVQRQRILSQQQGVTLSIVHFVDGARTYWHEHPGEQVLYVLEGECQVGTETGQERAEAGDTVHVPPGERHWHGAAPGSTMTHMSITTGGEARWFGPPPPR